MSVSYGVYAFATYAASDSDVRREESRQKTLQHENQHYESVISDSEARISSATEAAQAEEKVSVATDEHHCDKPCTSLVAQLLVLHPLHGVSCLQSFVPLHARNVAFSQC